MQTIDLTLQYVMTSFRQLRCVCAATKTCLRAFRGATELNWTQLLTGGYCTNMPLLFEGRLAYLVNNISVDRLVNYFLMTI